MVNVAATEGVAVVAVHAVFVSGDVDLDDVAVLERARVRDAVTDNFVDAGATRFGVVTVIEGRWVGAVVAHVFVSDAVEFVGGDSGLYGFSGLVHGTTSDPSGLFHGSDRLG